MSNGQQFDFMVTREEFNQGMQEMVDNILDWQKAYNELRAAHNTLAEVCGLHRFLFEKFMPKPLLEAAVNEFADLRAAAIANEQAEDAKKAN